MARDELCAWVQLALELLPEADAELVRWSAAAASVHSSLALAPELVVVAVVDNCRRL